MTLIKKRSFRAEETLISHLEKENYCFLVIEGSVRVTIYSESGKIVIFRDIGAGGIFGELSAIDNQPRSASVVAMEDCTVGVLSQNQLRDLVAKEPELAWALLRHLTSQVRVMTKRVIEFDTLSAGRRLEVELLRLANTGTQINGVVVVEPMPTNQDLAAKISSNREAVSRKISMLTDQGVLRKENRRLVFLNLSKLNQD